jgi:hypothetical protein
VTEDDGWFEFVCSLGEGDDLLTDRACRPKANPGLPLLPTEEYLERAVQQARNPSGLGERAAQGHTHRRDAGVGSGSTPKSEHYSRADARAPYKSAMGGCRD